MPSGSYLQNGTPISVPFSIYIVMLTTRMPIPLGRSRYLLRGESLGPARPLLPSLATRSLRSFLSFSAIAIRTMRARISIFQNRRCEYAYRVGCRCRGSRREHVDTHASEEKDRKKRSREPSQTDYNTRKVHDLLSGVTLWRWANTGGNPLTGPLCRC